MAANPQHGKYTVTRESGLTDTWIRIEDVIRFGKAVLVAGWIAPKASFSLLADGVEVEKAIVARTRGDVARGLRISNPDNLGFIVVAWAPGELSITIDRQIDPPFALAPTKTVVDVSIAPLPIRPNERHKIAEVLPKGSREQALILGAIKRLDEREDETPAQPAPGVERIERKRVPGEDLFDLEYLSTQAEAASDLLWTPPPKSGQHLADWYSENWRTTEIDPRPEFSVRFYLEDNPDVRDSETEPFLHYVMHGHRERRRPHPLVFPEFTAELHGIQNGSPGEFFALFEKPVWLNPLMRRPELLKNVTAALADLSEPVPHLFTFDYEAWLSRQQDVKELFPRHPIYHLFEYGLAESRLSRAEAIDRRLLFNGGEGRGSDLEALRRISEPAPVTTFSQVEPQALADRQDASSIYIGIVYYKNSSKEIAKMASSVAMQTLNRADSLDILVLDNSPDPIEGIVEAFEGAGLSARLTGTGNNVGFGRGHNSLMELAFSEGATHYIGLNPDGFLLPDAIRFALDDSARRDDAALIEMDSFPIGHPKWWSPVDGTTSWVSGAAFVCPRAVYENTGGFDPEFPLYGEDVDWSLRCRAAGIPTVVCGQSRFFHDITPRIGVVEPEREKNSLYGNWYLLEKWGAAAKATIVKNRLMELGVSEFPEIPKVKSVPNSIADDLLLSRYAHSRFWE